MKTITLLLFMTFLTQPGNLRAQQRPAGANNPGTRRVAFAQYCFWTGEMKLGQMEGVVRTEAGFFKGREVTLVEYAPERIALEDLAKRARQAGVADAFTSKPMRSVRCQEFRSGSRSIRLIERRRLAIKRNRSRERPSPIFNSPPSRPQK